MLDHVLDSLGCLLFQPVEEAMHFADVGSGGGLPGLPLAIALPDASFTLFEATGKKAAFLRSAVETLDLAGVEIVNARVEQAAHDARLRASHEICTVRAVAKLSVLAEYCLPLLKVGGQMVAMKGAVSEEEYGEGERAASLLGGRVLQVVEVPLLPEMEQKTRRLVVLEKTTETPEIYPRRVGLPAKSPLGRE
ncbi:MAG: 16S rRNA (guanine(527)-N(7))-methyltransferase RsmG [Actinomycetota bacterium]|nr:16S rRNA (guanine(527)-N(7))-methyltransferase RsmG [Actinomycetota bacterium]